MSGTSFPGIGLGNLAAPTAFRSFAMNLFRKGALTLCALLSLSFAMPAQQASAEGFSTYLEGSARAMSLAGGLVARGGDASVISYNPAAMTRLEGTQFQANLAVTQMYWGVDNPEGNAHSSHQTWPIPSWYLSHQLNDKVWLGIGQFTRFGLGVKYPNAWPGAQNLQSVQLITSSITPTMAYKLNEKISIGIGAEVLYADMQMRKQAVLNHANGAYIGGIMGSQGDANINGQGFAFGGNISLHAQLNDQWAVGFTYRTPMSLKVDGKIRADGALAMYGSKQNLHGTIHLPDSFAFGVAYKPTKALSIEAGATYTLWSRFADFNMYIDNRPPSLSNRHWRNNWAFNVSAEWWVKEWMALRLGFVFDKSPNNYGNADYMMPSNGRKYYTCGVGFKWDKWTLDLAYMYAHNHEQNYTESYQNDPSKGVLPGRTTHPHAHNFGIGIGYKF